MSSASAAADHGSSSTPQEGAREIEGNSRGVEKIDGDGGRGGDQESDDSEVEIVQGSKRKGVRVIQPAVVYTKKEIDLCEVDLKVVVAVDEYCPAPGFVRKGSREQSFMYSLGVYVEQEEGTDNKFFCMEDAACRRAKRKFHACSTCLYLKSDSDGRVERVE